MLIKDTVEETIKKATENDGILIALGKFPLDDTLYEGIYIAYPQSVLTPFNTNSTGSINGIIKKGSKQIDYELHEIGGWVIESSKSCSRYLHKTIGNIDTTYISLYKWEQFLEIVKDINTLGNSLGDNFSTKVYNRDYARYLCNLIVEVHILLGRYYTKAIIPNYIREISGGRITIRDLVDSRKKRVELDKILRESISKLKEISKPGILTEKQKTELNSFIYRTKIELI